MKLLFLVFPALVTVCFSQELIDLSDFSGNNIKNQLNTVPAPFGIYISAHSDSANLLSSMFIVTGNGKQISLNELKNRKAADNPSELEPYTVDDTAYLTTALTKYQLSQLNGVMYIGIFNQLLNNNFFVMDISNAMNIKLQRLGKINSTILFLNTNMALNPYKSSVISQWKQNGDSSAYLYANYPMDTPETKNSQIFSNPMKTDQTDVFFSNVEKFSIIMKSFYLKTFNGGPDFTVTPGYYSIDRTTTSAYTTTGFYMKQSGKIDSTMTINTMRDTKYSGVTGANIIGSLPVGGKVQVGEYDGASKNEFSIPPNDSIVPWSAPVIGQNIQISSENGAPGQYYVQYFVFQGQLSTGATSLPGRQTTVNPGNPTVPGKTTTKIETTTKSSGLLNTIGSMIIMTVYCLVLK
ncbi:hypothetical protein GCK72_019193 [Caenorhabditis remanei]|uniref:CUB-like domain-containing protein n=1 Tax=Caenorhabditis remanei TaxID=31234 RepID=A0A6A5GBZ5_CAERE|nr:hypothetical protein GCK72_019193 [Caenorhabditis remanei]KAF1752638.1 hypothetical protein GCK72_019193 [Caenorhabditis remanei]